MQSIVELNEGAIALIENGEYDSALDVLDIAMDQLHSSESEDCGEEFSSVVRRRQEEEVTEPLDESEEQPRSSRKKIRSDIVTPPSRKRSTTATKMIFEDTNGVVDGDFIYCFPIRYEIDEEEEELNSYQEEEEYPDEMSMGAIVMFNTALCHHLKAIRVLSSLEKEKSKNRHTTLKCALKLYQLCFQLVSEGEADLTTEQILALTNNCGQIYMELNRESKAKRFFTHMFTTLTVMIEDGSAQELDRFDGFMWNASKFLLDKNLTALLAPAA